MIKVLYPSCDFMRKSSCRHFQFWRQRIKTVSIAHNPEKLLLDYALYFLGTNLWTVKERTYYYEKIISILLALSMLFSLNTVAFAAESGTTDELQIVEENGTRTVSLNDGELTYIVTYDTVNNTICVAQKDNNTGLVEYGTVESTEITENSLVSARSKIHQDTFCNYEYDIYTGSPNEWNLERPKETGSGQNYFMVYENSSNSSQLDSWFNAVNSLNDKEWQAVSSYGAALVTSAAAGFISGMAVASGGILTPGAITAIVAATGATGTAAVLLTQVGTQCNVCLRAYWNVYNATDNMHF